MTDAQKHVIKLTHPNITHTPKSRIFGAKIQIFRKKRQKEFNFDFSSFENHFWRENSKNFAYLKKYVPAEVSPFEFEFDDNRSPGKSLGAEAIATNRSPGKSLGGGCMAIGALSI